MRATLRAVGRDDLAESPGQQGRALIQPENMAERATAVADGLARLTSEEVYRRMLDLQIPVAPILSHKEVLEDPQLTHNGTLIEAEHPVYGRYRRIRPAARFSETRIESTAGAPLYSADADAILEEMGIDAGRREQLRKLGVIP